MTAQEVDVAELLPLHALGALDADEAAAVERAIAKDPALRLELDSYREAAAAALTGERAIAPSPTVRARLLDDLEQLARPGPFDRFAARLGEMFDVTIDKARMFLGWMDEPARWEDAAVDGVQLIHLPPGPRWAAADCGLVRMPVGFHFPKHGHHGPELSFLLQGTITDSSGAYLEPGMELDLPGGLEHDFVIGEATGDYIFAIFAIRFYGIYGIELERK